MVDLLKKDRIVASVGLVFALLFAQRVVTFVRGIFFARLLGTEQYGIYTLGYFLILIAVSITGLGIFSAFGRYTPRYEAMGRVRWFLRKTFSLNIGVSFAVGLAVFLLPRFFSRLIYGDPSHTTVITAVALSIPALVIVKNLISTFSGLQLFRAGAVLEFSQVAAYAVLGIALVAGFRYAAVGMLAYAASLLITIPLFLPLLSRYLLSRESRLIGVDEPGFYRRLLRFTIWFTVIPVLGQILYYVDRLCLQRLMSSSDQGIYSAALNLSATISAAGLAINNVLYPHLSTTWEKGDKKLTLANLDLAIRSTTIALTVLGLVLVLLGRPMILALLGRDYLPGADVLPILVIFYLLTISAWLFGLYPALIERTHLGAIGLLGALPVNVVLNLALIPRLGIMGAGLATLISHITMWAVVVGLCRAYGMPLRLVTLLVSMLPFVMLLPKPAALAAVTGMLYICLARNWVISDAERRKVYTEVRAFLDHLRGGPGAGKPPGDSTLA